MKNNIIKDLSTLTTIPEKTLYKFYKKMNMCICEAVKDAVLDTNYQDSAVIEVDIGIGTLYVKRVCNETKYHFKPSATLQEALEQTFTKQENILQDFLVDTLCKKFTDEIYKDLC